MRLEQWEEAEEALQHASRLDPNSPLVWGHMALLLLSQGEDRCDFVPINSARGETNYRASTGKNNLGIVQLISMLGTTASCKELVGGFAPR